MTDLGTHALGPAWLAAVGDVVVLDTPTGVDPRLSGLLRAAETAFANVESPLTNRGVPAEKAFVHRSDPARAADLAALGIDVATLANNHVLDFGAEGLDDTLAALDRVGIAAVGAGRDDTAARAPVVRTTTSGRVALLGLSAALPPGFAAAPGHPGAAPLRVLQQVSIDPVLAAEQPGMAPFVHTSAVAADLDAACAAVEAARARADLVVVAVHWGVPHGFAAPSYGLLAQYQRPAGHALIEAGAHLVVGHHPHELHPVERHRGGLIAYSVGNFLFHAWSDLAGEFPMRVPAAPYLSAFGSDVTLDSVVVLVSPPGADGLTVRFVPATMAAGEPVLATGDRARAIVDRLSDGGPVVARADVLPDTTIGEVLLEP
ncbi:CapA family protein [Jiangella sp. DSM 45060]|uniref:CapA family protein n=1 Tax=Jiangella sp. DSM 45060 TaxID=1798224 RepID=UPI00087BADF3|nr:CapA family protein [Jiangella sp. DSM 45060]SDT67723.1 poly-gamma-glutamate synthesis protein (capsule biosynthesis protein) [Jiangella sp. DSM 45060]